MASDGTLNFDTKINSTGFSSGMSSISGIAKTGMSVVGVAVAAAATAIIGFGADSIKTGMEFDSAMSQVAATMGTTTDNIGELRDKAREMGKTTSFTATEAAEGMNILAMAGMNATEQIAAIDPVLRLAEAGATSMDNSASYLVTTMNGFNMTASETTSECREMENGMSNVQYTADLVAKGATMVVSSVDDLGEALSASAASAGSYGQSVETTTTALMGLANGGITGSKAATYLNRAMTNLYAPTSSASNAMQELSEKTGITISAYDEATGETRDFLDVVADLDEATSMLTDEEKNHYLQTIMGTQGLKAYKAITTSSTEELAKMKEEVSDCAGACEQMAETQLDNLEGDITKCKSAFSDLQIAISDECKDSLRDFVQFGTEQIMVLDDAITENGLQGGFEALGTVLANLINEVGAAAPSMLEATKNLIHSFCEGIKGGTDSVDAMNEVLIALVDCVLSSAGDLASTALVLIQYFAEGLVSALPDLISAGMQAVPTICEGIETGIPELIAGAVDLIAQFTTAIISALPELAMAAVEIVVALVNGLVNGFPEVFNAAAQLLTGIVEAIPEFIPTLAESIPQIIETLVSGLGNALPEILSAAINLLMAIVQAIPTIVSSLAAALPQIIATIISSLGAAVPQVLETGKNLLGQVVEAIPTVVTNLAGAIPDIISGIVNGLMSGIGSVFDAAASLGEGILDGIKGFLGINSPSTVMTEQGEYITEGLVQGIQDMPEQCMSYFDSLTEYIVAWGANLAEVVNNAATLSTEQIVMQFEQLPILINEYLMESLAGISEWGASMNASMTAAVSGSLGGVDATFAQLPAKVNSYLTQTISRVSAFGSQLTSSIKNATSTAVNGAVTTFAQLPSKIGAYLTQTISRVTTFGNQLSTNMKNAANNAVTGACNYFAQLPTKVGNYLNQTLSTVTSWGTTLASTAKSIASNFCTQFTSGLSSLNSSVSSVLSSVNSTVKSYASTLYSSGYSTGQNLVSGMIAGINNKSSSLYSTISSVVSTAVKKANSAAGTASPSKFLEWTGEMMDKGLALGLTEYSSLVNSAMDDVMSIMDKANDVTYDVAFGAGAGKGFTEEAQAQVDAMVARMRAAVNSETQRYTAVARANAGHQADIDGGRTFTEKVTEKFNQYNTYEVPVASPATVSKENRETMRKMVGGVI